MTRANYKGSYPFVGSGFVMKIETNAQGFRDSDWRPAEAGEKTIVFAGDSFTFGQGVNIDDRFDTQLAQLLDASGHSCRLINTGVNGWGTLQQKRFLLDHFVRLQPDILVLTFCGNDPFNDAYFGNRSATPRTMTGKTWLTRNSHLARYVLRQYFTWGNNRHMQARALEPGITVDKQSGSIITPEDWENSLTNIRALREAFHSYNPEGSFFVQATAPTNPDFRTRLAPLSDEPGTMYVDLHDRAKGFTPEQQRLPYDRHWSPVMHRISAEGLFEAIVASEPAIP
jgi:lysophospholipase L1-like esterase